MADRQRAQVFSTRGIEKTTTAQSAAAEALLATAQLVPGLAATLAKAVGGKVDSRTEVTAYGAGRVGTSAVQGVLEVARSRSTWSAAFVVRVGNGKLSAAAVKKLATACAANDVDAIVSISNDPEAPDVGRSRLAVPMVHVPWGGLLDGLAQQRLSDPEQAAILEQLVAFLTSEPLQIRAGGSDMGANWAGVARTARTSRLSRRDAGVLDVCRRWDQVVNLATARLGEVTGRAVSRALPAKHRRDDAERIGGIVDSITSNGQLIGEFTVPNAAGDLAVVADLSGSRIVTVAVVTPPKGLGARASVGWLLDGLGRAPKGTVVESWSKNGREPLAAATVDDLDRDMNLLGDSRGRVGDSFRILQVAEMATGRNGGRGEAFVDSIDAALEQAWVTALGPLSGAEVRPTSTRRSAPSRSTTTSSSRKAASTSRKAKPKPQPRRSSGGSASRRSTKAPSRRSSSSRGRRSAAEVAAELRGER